MTIIISTSGIGPSVNGDDDRSIVYLDIEYNKKLYAWKIYMPSTNSLAEYITTKTPEIQADIDYKEGVWANSDPNVVSYSDIVKPDDIDYYLRRKENYPSIPDQLSAIFKGTYSKEFYDMANTINAIKTVYPKTRLT